MPQNGSGAYASAGPNGAYAGAGPNGAYANTGSNKAYTGQNRPNPSAGVSNNNSNSNNVNQSYPYTGTRNNNSPINSNYDVRNNSGITAEQLNGRLKGALSGQGQTFINAGKQYGIDPAFLASISMFETGNGSSSAARNKHNAMGISNSRGPIAFNSIESSIYAGARNLRNNYVNQGLTFVAQIQRKYCPVGAENDPNGTNGEWRNGVTNNLRRLIG